MQIDATKTVREVALAIPNATRVFEKIKIDYCCGGDRLFGDACARAGLQINEVERLLKENAGALSSAPVDFQRLSLAELIVHILERHHVFTKSEMERLESLVAKVVAAHDQRHPELLSVRDLLAQLFADLRPHMFKEEQILFPFIVELEQSVLQQRREPFAPFGSVNNPIRMMMMEHDAVGELLRELREVTSDYSVPADGCISYQTLYQAIEAFEQDLHQHIHLENNVLFPKAIALESNL